MPNLRSLALAAVCLAGAATAGMAMAQSAADRLAARAFPSVFQAWNPAEGLANEEPLATMARHDLVFHVAEGFGLQWNNRHVGLADGFTPASIEAGRATRAKLRLLNPSILLLIEIRYRDASKDHLPDGHSWWMRRDDGTIVPGWAEGGHMRLDLHSPEFRQQVAKQAKAAVDSGVADGVMLDWWSDDEDRPLLAKAVREAIGPEALILANASDRQVPKTAAFLNGLFMECYASKTAQDWERIATTLRWAESHLRPPRINCLETWYRSSRNDLNLMRATTTLALTQSNGFCLFSDPNDLPAPDHLHNWYSFWNRSLGKPMATGKRMPDGSWRRQFQTGMVVYNPMGRPRVTVEFSKPMRSLATGAVATKHTVAPCDGDIYCPVTP